MKGKILLKPAELPIDLKFQLLVILDQGENQWLNKYHLITIVFTASQKEEGCLDVMDQ